MVVRDPVHGDIVLQPEEVALLDTREMQRLRGIKQLGTAYLVYPGCHHTRFEHALGTMHCAATICERLKKQGFNIRDEDVRLVRIAALVHDVSHIPFGHTFEDERKVFPRHDQPGRLRDFLFSGELGQRLQQFQLAKSVYDVLTQGNTWQADIVAGALDADLMDYVRRDAYFTGLSHTYDDRMYRYFTLDNDRLVVRLARDGIDRADARSEVVHLLRMRYVLTERVYMHHAKISAGAMISKALEYTLDKGLSLEMLYDLSDTELLVELTKRWGAESAHLARAVMERRLYKRAFEATAHTVGEMQRWELSEAYHRPGKRRARLEEQIAQEAGVEPHHVIVYVPALTTFKEVTVPVITSAGTMPLNRAAGTQLEISALEAQYRNLWRMFVFAPASHQRAVGKAAEKILEIQNERQRKTGALN